MPKYSEGTVSPTGQYIVQGGKWVPRSAPAAVSDPRYKAGAEGLEAQRQTYNTLRNQQPLLNAAADMVTGGGGQPNGTGALGDLFNFPADWARWHDNKVKTGGILNNAKVPFLDKTRPGFSRDAGRFYDIGQQLQTGIRDPSKDSQVSNYERELLGSTSPSLQKDQRTNREIIARRTAAQNEMGDRLAFEEDYLNTHGNLAGASEKWEMYLQSSPYYGPSQKGNGNMVALVHEPDQWRQRIYGQRAGFPAPVKPPMKVAATQPTAKLPSKRRPLSDIFGQ